MTIHLQDLLHLSEEDIQRAGIKLMFFDGNKEPIDEWLKNKKEIDNWLFWGEETKTYFNEEDIAVGLVHIHGDYWLLTTVSKVKENLHKVNDRTFNSDPIDEYNGFLGRTVIHFHNHAQQKKRIYKTHADEFEVYEILPRELTKDDCEKYARL